MKPALPADRPATTHPLKGRTGWVRVWRAFGYSMAGLAAAWRGESAFRQEAVLALLMLPWAPLLGRTWSEAALLAGTVLLVLVVELLNSAVEAAVDRVSFEWNELAGRAKDFGSAAVFLALLLCGVTWLAALYQWWQG